MLINTSRRQLWFAASTEDIGFHFTASVEETFLLRNVSVTETMVLKTNTTQEN